MARRKDQEVGLLGGSLEARLRSSSVPPLEMEPVLAPFRRAGDEARFARFIARRPLHIEIGFGRAHHLLALAAQRADAAVLGFETRRDWCRLGAERAQKRELANVALVEGDARPYMERLVPKNSADFVHVLFPDPWWKRRHHKRRLIEGHFIELVYRLLNENGSLIWKTDVPAYAARVEETLGEQTGWRLIGTHSGSELLGELPKTHREKKCKELGIPVYSFHFQKEGSP